MALDLPRPTPPASGSARHARAYRQWQAGESHAQREQWPMAAQAYEQAFSLHHDSAFGLAAAHALIRAGRADQALQRARALRLAQPQLAPAYTLESHALFERGRNVEALEGLLALPPGAPRDHGYLVSLAVALQRCHKLDEAIPVFFQALALKMDDAPVHFRLGMAFKDKGMKAEAAECVRTAVALGVGDSDLAARAQLAFLEREACRWPQADEAWNGLRAALAATPAGGARETGPFPHAVLGDDPLEQRRVAEHYALHAATGVKPLPRRPARAQGGRLRIGYLSSDFHQHATSQLVVQMLEAHERARVEVTLFSAGPDDGSAMRRRVVAASEHFEELRGRPHAEIAQRIRERQIDILVDLKGATFGTLLPVMAHRAAPLQVSWLGFPGTSGAPFIDYLIGDPVVTPLEHAAHFSEKLAQMPHCYQPNDALRVRPLASKRSDWGAPDGKLLLCAFHQSYKISETVFDTWCRILHALPDAVLWLMRWNTNVQAALEAAAAARGIGKERLLFAPFVPAEQHLARLACADLYLDAWPCNAHTTAGEALWAGVPVVTLEGPTFAQRVAASLIGASGQGEGVASATNGYVAHVLALAHDPVRRAALRERLLAARDTSPLFDGVRFARDIEALYGRMWARACAGQAPDHLAADPAGQ